MMQGVISATPPGGLGGAGAPQCVDPLSYLVKLKRTEPNRTEAIQKVSSIWLKIADRVAYG